MMTAIKPICIAAMVIALSGCMAETKPDEPQAPTLRIVKLGPHALACLPLPKERGEKWRTACAPIIGWLKCVETKTRMECENPNPGTQARFD